jgi:hypothetical protein
LWCGRSKQAVGSDGIGIFKKEMACFICVATETGLTIADICRRITKFSSLYVKNGISGG